MNAVRLFSIDEVARAAGLPAAEVLDWAVRLPGGPQHRVAVEEPCLDLRRAMASAAAASFRLRKARVAVAEDVLRAVMVYPDDLVGSVVRRAGKAPAIEASVFSEAYGRSGPSRAIPMIFDLDDFAERLLTTMDGAE